MIGLQTMGKKSEKDLYNKYEIIIPFKLENGEIENIVFIDEDVDHIFNILSDIEDYEEYYNKWINNEDLWGDYTSTEIAEVFSKKDVDKVLMPDLETIKVYFHDRYGNQMDVRIFKQT